MWRSLTTWCCCSTRGWPFGTGLHPTTRLCLRAVEELDTGQTRARRRGGVGILSIAAARLGARRVDAVELEPVAAQVCQDNVARNGVVEIVTVRAGTLETAPAEPVRSGPGEHHDRDAAAAARDPGRPASLGWRGSPVRGAGRTGPGAPGRAARRRLAARPNGAGAGLGGGVRRARVTHRFLVPGAHAAEEIELSAAQQHQLRHVLRLRAGAVIQVFDGQEAVDLVAELTPAMTARVTGHVAQAAEPRTSLFAWPALLQREKFEIVLQKLTELGVTAITPVLTERGLVRGRPG